MPASFTWRHFFRPRKTAQEPVTLGPNRIYILPTKGGVLFFVLLMAMLLISINYNNPPGYLLTFLLAGVGFVSIFHTHRTLHGLLVQHLPAQAVFAGGQALFPVMIRNPAITARYGVTVSWTRLEAGMPQDIAAKSECRIVLSLPADSRGKLSAGPVVVASIFPLGLLRAWSRVHLPMSCIVYPQPERGGPLWPSPPPEHARQPGEDGQNAVAGQDGDDFSGLRSYRLGDPPRQVAWKATARSEAIYSKEFSTQAEGAAIWLRWLDAGLQDVEATLSRLCRWLLEADKTGHPFGLVLPGLRIDPSTGKGHLHRCLSALAGYEAGPEAM